jgi:hypothetical protein
VKFFTRIVIVFIRLGKTFMALALATTLGTHWALLQSVAWVGMIASYSEHSTFKDAVEMTFDGKHPCPLCKAIAAAKKSQQKNEFSLQNQKLEFPPAEENFILIAPAQFQLLQQENSFAKSLTQKPPFPPPREFLV